MEEKNCNCIFCQMNCPKCGEWEGIQLRMNVLMEVGLDNCIDGELLFEKYVYRDDIEVYCDLCRHSFTKKETDKLKREIYNATKIGEDQTIVSKAA